MRGVLHYLYHTQFSKTFVVRVSSFNLRALSEIFLLPQADFLVSPDWVRSCCEPDFASEALLHEARFHAAPAVRLQ